MRLFVMTRSAVFLLIYLSGHGLAFQGRVLNGGWRIARRGRQQKAYHINPTTSARNNIDLTSLSTSRFEVDGQKLGVLPCFWRGFRAVLQRRMTGDRSDRRKSKIPRVKAATPLASVLALLLWLSFPGSVHASEAAAAASAAPPLVASHSMISIQPVLRFHEELRLCFRLCFAAIAGSVVGRERSSHPPTSHHPNAGIRTMSLVSLGAAAFTLCSIYGFLVTGHRPSDPSRMAANVASGVGFIGAGVITTTTSCSHSASNNIIPLQTSSDACGDSGAGMLREQSQELMNAQQETATTNVVHGLTTAAAIWLSAAIGVASGAGLYAVATVTTLSTVAILQFGRLKNRHLDHPQQQHDQNPTWIVRTNDKGRSNTLPRHQQHSTPTATGIFAGAGAAERYPEKPSIENDHASSDWGNDHASSYWGNDNDENTHTPTKETKSDYESAYNVFELMSQPTLQGMETLKNVTSQALWSEPSLLSMISSPPPSALPLFGRNYTFHTNNTTLTA